MAIDKMKTLAKVLASSWQVFVNGLGRSGFSYFLLSAASSGIRHLPALDRRGTTAGDAQLHLALCGLKLEEASGRSADGRRHPVRSSRHDQKHDDECHFPSRVRSQGPG